MTEWCECDPPHVMLEDEAMVALAQQHPSVSEGDLEVDDGAEVSKDDKCAGGAYVQAWIWVDYPTVEEG